jgi:hypothetical protein
MTLRRFVELTTQSRHELLAFAAMHLIRHGAQSDAHVLPHQSGLLVLKDVAMIHERVVARCGLIKTDEKLRFVLNKHHVLPAREMRRRRRSRDGQDAEQGTVDMKRMCHSSRDYLPDLCGSEVGLDIDACHVKRFSVYPCEGDHIRMLAILRAVHANSAVHNELPPPHCRSLRGRLEFDKTGRHFFDERLRRGRFKAHHGHIVCASIGR